MFVDGVSGRGRAPYQYIRFVRHVHTRSEYGGLHTWRNGSDSHHTDSVMGSFTDIQLLTRGLRITPERYYTTWRITDTTALCGLAMLRKKRLLQRFECEAAQFTHLDRPYIGVVGTNLQVSWSQYTVRQQRDVTTSQVKMLARCQSSPASQPRAQDVPALRAVYRPAQTGTFVCALGGVDMLSCVAVHLGAVDRSSSQSKAPDQRLRNPPRTSHQHRPHRNWQWSLVKRYQNLRFINPHTNDS